MTPILRQGPGKSFGELAVQKVMYDQDLSRPKQRAATVFSRTDCKLAVINRDEYQRIFDNLDRRKTSKLLDFFKQVPFLKMLPKKVLSTLHLSLTRKRF